MNASDRQVNPPSRGVDLAPLLFLVLALFVVGGAFQFAHNWAGGSRGLLLFEKACPISDAPADRSM